MNTLRHFKPDEVFLTSEQAARVLRYFFPDQPINPGDATPEDRAFAQALLIEAVDASKEMGYVHVLYDTVYLKPPVDFSLIEDLAKGLGKYALKNWFQHATGEDLKNPQIYAAVRGQITSNFKSVWGIRINGAGLDY